MTFRVSGLALRYFSRVLICHRIACRGSTVTASTLAGIPLRMRAEPTKSPGIKSPSLRSSFDTVTLPRIISETEAKLTSLYEALANISRDPGSNPQNLQDFPRR